MGPYFESFLANNKKILFSNCRTFMKTVFKEKLPWKYLPSGSRTPNVCFDDVRYGCRGHPALPTKHVIPQYHTKLSCLSEKWRLRFSYQTWNHHFTKGMRSDDSDRYFTLEILQNSSTYWTKLNCSMVGSNESSFHWVPHVWSNNIIHAYYYVCNLRNDFKKDTSLNLIANCIQYFQRMCSSSLSWMRIRPSTYEKVFITSIKQHRPY